MRTWATVLVTLAIGSMGASSVSAQGTGRSLDIQPGARQNGLGAAGVALESDPCDALWWNPAALGFAQWGSVQYTRAQLVPGLASDVYYQHLAGAGNIGSRLGIGASGTFLSYGTGYGSEWSAAAAIGFRVLPGLAVGVTAKYLNIDFLLDETTTHAFDLGGLYRADLDPLRLSVGVSLQNAGPEVEFEFLGRSPLSRNLKMGCSATLPTRIADVECGATAVVDYNRSQVTDDYRVWNYGVEAYVGDRKRIQAALRLGYYDDDLGEIGAVTYGAGLRVFGMSLDLASIPQADDSGLPNVKKWSFGLHSDGLRLWMGSRPVRNKLPRTHLFHNPPVDNP